MNKYVKSYLFRGLIFSGLGPIVFGIVMMVLQLCNVEVVVDGKQLLLGIVSTYLIAFVTAGSTVFEQIENWSTIKAIFVHMMSVYLVYLFGYLSNRWIPLRWNIILIFSISVLVGFLLIWFIVYLIVNNTTKKLNKQL